MHRNSGRIEIQNRTTLKYKSIISTQTQTKSIAKSNSNGSTYFTVTMNHSHDQNPIQKIYGSEACGHFKIEKILSEQECQL